MARRKSKSPTKSTAPLSGLHIGVALAADASYSPAPLLARQGAEISYYPCEEMLPLDDLSDLDKAIQDAAEGKFDRILVTTPESVLTLLQRIEALGLDAKRLQQSNLAVFGVDTQMALAAELGQPSADNEDMPTDYASFVKALDVQPGNTYLLLVPAGRTPEWPEQISAQGAEVSIVPAYRAHMRRDGDDLPGLLWAGRIDTMVFVSADNVRYFATRLRHDGATLAMLDHVPVACIDQRTADTAATYGLRVPIIAPAPTPDALAQAIADYFAEPNHA